MIHFTSRLHQIRSKTKSPPNQLKSNRINYWNHSIQENSGFSWVSKQIEVEPIPKCISPKVLNNNSIKANEKTVNEDKDIDLSEQTTPSSKASVIINSNEKRKALDYGYSLDKRKTNWIPIYSDLHKTSFGLAQAVFRHIKFSRGMLFLEDLALIINCKEIQGSAIKRNNDIKNKIDFSPSQNMLKFNYCFDKNLRFELSGVKPKNLFNACDTVEGIK